MSEAPPTGKYKPKHDVVEKNPKKALVAKIPDKSEVRESIKPVPGCIMLDDVPCDRETRKAFFYSKNPDKKRPDEPKITN